jgi:ribosomal protein S18 acetylase RimI-like enzyme
MECKLLSEDLRKHDDPRVKTKSGVFRGDTICDIDDPFMPLPTQAHKVAYLPLAPKLKSYSSNQSLDAGNLLSALVHAEELRALPAAVQLSPVVSRASLDDPSANNYLSPGRHLDDLQMCTPALDCLIRECSWRPEDHLELVDVNLVNDLAEAARLNSRPPLLEQMCRLSKRCFSEDGLKKALDGGWQMTFLKETCSDGSMALLGYICYELWPTAEFHIRRVAVVEGQRGRGLGQKLMHSALAKAARIPQSKCEWITLSAFNSAVTFYEQLGFTDMGCGDPRAEGGQIWMELKNVSEVLDGRETDVAEETDVADEDAVSRGWETESDDEEELFDL